MTTWRYNPKTMLAEQVPDPLTPLTPAQTTQAEAKALHEPYVERVLVEDDVAINVALGGLPDETMSARAARSDASGSKFGRAFSWLLTKIGFGRNHGSKAAAGDAARAAQVAAAEKDSGLINR